MKKIIFVLLLLGLFTTPALAWSGYWHVGHRGYFPGPRIIINPGPRCEYQENVIYFSNTADAIQWIDLNRSYITNPVIKTAPTYVEVYYTELYCR